MQTPVGIYMKIRDLYTNSVLLESADYHGNENSFSYIGFDAIGGISVNRFLITETYPDGKKISTPVTDKMTVAERFNCFLKSFELSGQPSKRGLINGLLGYTSYEAIQYFEEIRLHAKETIPGSMPGLHYMLFKYIIAINHFNNELTIIENLPNGDDSKMAEVEAMLLNNNFAVYDFHLVADEKSDISDEDFLQMIAQGKKAALKKKSRKLCSLEDSTNSLKEMTLCCIERCARLILLLICSILILMILEFLVLLRNLI